MTLPAFLRFDPVTVRSRRDGWTAPLQRRFIVNLARGMGPAEAARSVGRSRQTAYGLRERPDGGGFAAAWDSAVEFARTVRAAPKPLGDSAGAVEAVLVPRYYRGRLVGFVQREDLAGAMRRLGELDRAAERLAGLDPNAPSFDTAINALVAGMRAEADKADAMSRANVPRASASARLRLRQPPSERLG